MDNRWNEMYELAKKYYLHYGNLEIKRQFRTKNGYDYDIKGKKLGGWINTQRMRFKNRFKTKEEIKNTLILLTDEQVEKLTSIGMIFEIDQKDKIQKHWDKMYELARQYYFHYHNLSIRTDFKTVNGYEYDETGECLGTWISRQRVAYKNRNKVKNERKNEFAPLTDDKLEKLLNIGMIFEFKENKLKNIELCKFYGLNYDENNFLIESILYEELNAKINYLIENNIPLEVNGQVHEIFFMSSTNMKVIYGFTKEELIEKYYNIIDVKVKIRK